MVASLWFFVLLVLMNSLIFSIYKCSRFGLYISLRVILSVFYMRLVFLGPPGAGKGTQAISVSKKYGIPHIAIGDIFRSEILQGTKLGLIAKEPIAKGNFVPNEITIEIVRKRICRKDCLNGFVLDGFPRDMVQAPALEDMCPVDYVLEIHCPIDIILKRLSGRRICRDCRAIYHLLFGKPKIESICDKCGGKLYQRADDNEKSIMHRIDVYHEKTEPLIEFYKDMDKYVRIDGSGSVEEVFDSIVSEISKRF